MFIFIRRFFAIVFLLPIFLLLTIATLLVFRVNDTVLEPDFYVGALRALDVFNFVYDEGVPYAIERAEQNGDIALDAIPLGLELTPQKVAGSMAAVVPPEWLEENAETIVNAVIPYLAGDEDGFSVTITLDDRAEAAADEFKALVVEADVHSFLVDDVVQDQLQSALISLPFGLILTPEQVTAGIIEVVPQDWLKGQINSVVDETTPYLVGKSETFSVTIAVDERAPVAIDVVEGWFMSSLDGGAYEYLLEEQIAPVVILALGAFVDLPFGVRITEEEFVDAFATVLPAEWVQDRVEDAVDQIGPWILGETEDFLLTIPLEDRTQAASQVLVGIADSKFEAIYNGLPTCTGTQNPIPTSLFSLPDCRSALIDYATFKLTVESALGFDLEGALSAAFIEPIPDEITLNKQIILVALGEDAALVDDVREILRDGYTFTSNDLIALIESQAPTATQAEANIELFEDVRTYLRDGVTFTNTDFETQVNDPALIDQFDDVRGYIAQGRSLLFLLAAPSVFIALLIGLLGGRRWGTRIAWMGVPLLLVGAIGAGAFGPAATFGFDAGQDVIAKQGIAEVFLDKLLAAVEEMRQSFVVPLMIQSIAIAALGLAMIAGGLVMGRPKQA